MPDWLDRGVRFEGYVLRVVVAVVVLVAWAAMRWP